MTTERKRSARAREIAANVRDCAVRHYPNREPAIIEIAAILARHYSPREPASAPTEPKPTSPGWYECQCKQTHRHMVLWWDGHRVSFSRDGWGFTRLTDYTDFIPLAAGREEGEEELKKQIVSLKTLLSEAAGLYKLGHQAGNARRGSDSVWEREKASVLLKAIAAVTSLTPASDQQEGRV